jgi:hypothetical protein
MMDQRTKAEAVKQGWVEPTLPPSPPLTPLSVVSDISTLNRPEDCAGKVVAIKFTGDDHVRFVRVDKATNLNGQAFWALTNLGKPPSLQLASGSSWPHYEENTFVGEGTELRSLSTVERVDPIDQQFFLLESDAVAMVRREVAAYHEAGKNFDEMVMRPLAERERIQASSAASRSVTREISAVAAGLALVAGGLVYLPYSLAKRSNSASTSSPLSGLTAPALPVEPIPARTSTNSYPSRDHK